MKDTGLARDMIFEVCFFVFLLLVVWWVGALVCVCVCVWVWFPCVSWCFVFLGFLCVLGLSGLPGLCFLVWVCARLCFLSFVNLVYVLIWVCRFGRQTQETMPIMNEGYRACPGHDSRGVFLRDSCSCCLVVVCVGVRVCGCVCVCVCVCVCLGLVFFVILGVVCVLWAFPGCWCSWACRVLCFLVWVCARLLFFYCDFVIL